MATVRSSRSSCRWDPAEDDVFGLSPPEVTLVFGRTWKVSFPFFFFLVRHSRHEVNQQRAAGCDSGSAAKVLGPLLLRFRFDLCGCFQLFHAYFIPIDPCEIKHHTARVRIPDVPPSLPALTLYRAAVLGGFFLFFSFLAHQTSNNRGDPAIDGRGGASGCCRAGVFFSHALTVGCSAARSGFVA